MQADINISYSICVEVICRRTQSQSKQSETFSFFEIRRGTLQTGFLITRRAFLSREISKTTRGTGFRVNKNHKANESDVSTVGIMVQFRCRQLSNNNIMHCRDVLQRSDGIPEKPHAPLYGYSQPCRNFEKQAIIRSHLQLL